MENKEFYPFYWIRYRSIGFVKENLNLLILIPPIIGGFWQIMELSQMSLSYVRFFSVTQLIADGLLILLLFILLFGVILIIPFYEYWVFPESSNKILISKEAKSERETLSDRYPLLSFLILIGLVFGTVYFVSHFEVDGIASFSLFTVLSLLILLILGQYYMSQRKRSKKNIKVIYLLSPFVGFTIFIFFLMFCHHVHRLYLLPSELKNIQILKSKIENTYSVKKFEVLYLNDKYIFIGTSVDKNKDSILIIQFEELVKIDPK